MGTLRCLVEHEGGIAFSAWRLHMAWYIDAITFVTFFSECENTIHQQVRLEAQKSSNLKSGNSKDCFLVGVGIISQWILPFFGDVAEVGNHGKRYFQVSKSWLFEQISSLHWFAPKIVRVASWLGLIGAHPLDVEMCTATAASSLAVVSCGQVHLWQASWRKWFDMLMCWASSLNYFIDWLYAHTCLDIVCIFISSTGYVLLNLFPYMFFDNRNEYDIQQINWGQDREISDEIPRAMDVSARREVLTPVQWG